MWWWWCLQLVEHDITKFWRKSSNPLSSSGDTFWHDFHSQRQSTYRLHFLISQNFGESRPIHSLALATPSGVTFTPFNNLLVDFISKKSWGHRFVPPFQKETL